MKKRISFLTTLALLSSLVYVPSTLAITILPSGSNYFPEFLGGLLPSSSGSVIDLSSYMADPTNEFQLEDGIGGKLYIGFEEKFDGVVFNITTRPAGIEHYEVSFWDDGEYDWVVLEEDFQITNSTGAQSFEFNRYDEHEDLMEEWAPNQLPISSGSTDALYFLRFELVSQTGSVQTKASQVGIINYNMQVERPYDTDLLEHVDITEDDITLNSTDGDETIYNSMILDNGNLMLAIHNKNYSGHSSGDERDEFHPYSATLHPEGHTQAYTDDYPYFDEYMVGYSSRWNDAEIQRTHRINVENEAGDQMNEAQVIAGKNDTECELRSIIGSSTAFCALTIAEDDSETTTVSAPGYVTQTKSIPNRYFAAQPQKETNVELEFAYKIHVENEAGLNISNATVKMGDDLDISCEYYSSGDYFCAVPVSEADGNVQITHSDYESITTSLSSSKIRNSSTDAQSTQDFVLSGEPTPDPEVEGVDLDVDNIYLDSDDDLKFRVSNDGDTDVDSGIAIHMKVYVDGEKIYSTNVYNESSSSWLRAGNSATYNLGEVLRDESTVRVCVDTEDAVEEDNESNNCLEAELGEDNDGDEPDLTAVDIELEEDGDLRVTLKNKGQADVDEDIEVLVYAYLDGRVEWEKEYENDYSASWLNEDEEERIRISDFVEDDDEDEIHSIKICVDKRDSVDERNEENNCNSVSLRLGEHEDDDNNDDDDDDEYENDCGFVDMNRHWASEEVCELVDRDIVQGRSERYYEPNQYVTRAEFLKLLLLTSGRSPRDVDGYYFNDVPEYHWAHDYISYASSLGVARGYGDGSFRPNANVTRGEAVVMIMRIYGEELWNFDENDIIFPDVDRFDWFAYAVILAESYNIVGGYADGTFRPGNELTRAEAAVIMMNMDDSLN